MNINKIIEKILSNSIVNTKGDIDVNDNSYLWDIIQNPEDSTGKKFNYGIKFSVGDSIKERYHASLNNKKYPITYFVYRVIVYLFKLMIWCFYRVASSIRQLFISDKGNKDRAVDVSTSPRFNFIVFIATIVTYIVLIVIILSFFIKSVLLFRPDTRINESGAITMPQSCERENYMYLLNSATYWGNSGIKVMKGDEVSITVSGSFFSKIGEMYKSALNNKLPKYDRTFVSFDKNKKQKSDTTEHKKLLVANLKYPNCHINDKFGSLLIQIRDHSDHISFHKDSIISDTAYNSSFNAFIFKAEKSGYLHFAVNDEYITETDFDRIKRTPWLQDSLDIYNLAKLSKNNYLKLVSIIKNDSAVKQMLNRVSLDQLLSYFEESGYVYLTQWGFDFIKNNKICQDSIGWTEEMMDTLTVWDKWNERIATMWYSDNVGDILINVRIKRHTVQGNILEPSILSRAYREIEDFFLASPFGYRKILTIIGMLLLIAGWMALDYIDGRGILECISRNLCDPVKRILSKQIDS